jgi:hypothetical protein
MTRRGCFSIPGPPTSRWRARRCQQRRKSAAERGSISSMKNGRACCKFAQKGRECSRCHVTRFRVEAVGAPIRRLKLPSRNYQPTRFDRQVALKINISIGAQNQILNQRGLAVKINPIWALRTGSHAVTLRKPLARVQFGLPRHGTEHPTCLVSPETVKLHLCVRSMGSWSLSKGR